MDNNVKIENVSPVTEEIAAAEETAAMPEMLTVMPSPHIRASENTAKIMLKVIIALLPAYAWGVYVYGLRALLIGVIAIASAVGFEALTQYILHRKITVSDLSAVVTGLLLAMNLPASVPLWMPVAGSAVAIVLVKQLFGGIGKNFMNPALLARVFLMLAWTSEFRYTAAYDRLPVGKIMFGEGDIVASATPLASLKTGALPTASLKDMLFGNIGGCIGEVSALLLIVGGIFLLCTKVITWHIPAAYIGTVALVTFIFPKTGNNLESMLFELLAGGLLLGAFFMATDYSTSPTTPVGRIVFGVGCGLITVLIRYFGSYPEGVSFSILIMNMLVWYIDKAFMPRKFGGKKCRTK